MIKAKLSGDGSQTFKVLVLGHTKCGKSCFVNCAVTGLFKSEYCQTIGAELIMKQVTTASGEKVTLQLWSCSGQRRFLPTVHQLYTNVQGAIIMYDATSMRSFKDVVFWHNEILRGSPNAVIALVGSKSDLIDEQRISEEDGKAQAADWDATHFRSSSKDGDTVERVLHGLISKMI